MADSNDSLSENSLKKTLGSFDPKKVGTILIVEDDDIFRKLLVKTLASLGFNIREASNGLVAKTIFDLAPVNYSLIISDIRMPELDGVALLKHVRGISQIPFIVMTGFSEIMDTTKAFELGANEFVPKPFRIDVLSVAINNCLNPKKKSEQVDSFEKLEYCPIHIDEFISASHLQSDIYVKLSPKHYVRVAHKGEVVPVDRLRTYKNREVDYLYITIADFAPYVNFNIKLTGAALKADNIDRAKKTGLVMQTTKLALERCYLDQLSPEAVRPAHALVETTISLLLGDDDILQLFASMAEQADRLYAHGVSVALFSAIVARANGWGSASTLFKVITGGLLHDIGKRELNPDLVKMRRILRNEEQTKQIESHCARGRDLASQIKSLPEDISQICYQHHQCPSGGGYPPQLKGEIHPLARLIGSIDCFVERTLPISPDVAGSSPHEALRWIRENAADTVEISFIRKLEDIFVIKKSAKAA